MTLIIILVFTGGLIGGAALHAHLRVIRERRPLCKRCSKPVSSRHYWHCLEGYFCSKCWKIRMGK